jgi:AcrR family transcriptional regulator
LRVPTAERREQLLDATIEVMKREGVEKTGLRKVAVEARASLAAIHVCFEDKEQMMEMAVERFLSSLVAAMADDIATLTKGVRHTALELMDRFWATLVEEPLVVLSQIEIGAWAHRNTQHSKLLVYIYERYVREFNYLLSESARLSGESLQMPVNLLTRALIAIGDGSILAYLAEPDSPDHRVVFDQLIDHVLAAAGV